MDVRIVDGVVVELFPEGAPEFHPDILIVSTESEVDLGWTWDGDVFSSPPPFTQTADEIREIRNQMLIDSDWVMVEAQATNSEVPEDWASYRQALRDLPQQAGFPENVEWPIRPDLVDLAAIEY